MSGTLDEMLLCTVRDCRQALIQQEQRMVCAKGHTFDIARSGYINLLQPQDKRSRNPGDSAAAIAARRRLHDKGFTQPLLQAICTLLAGGKPSAVLDVGCGDGYYLNGIADTFHADCTGIDISVPAIEAAARRYRCCQWIVANADRFLPWSAGTFSTIISITGRMNPADFRRVLRPGGQALIAVPALDDLIEIRGAGRERIARTIEDFRGDFSVLRQERATTTAELDAASIEDVLLAIYRPIRKEPVQPMRMTFSLDLLLLQTVD